MKQTPLNAAHRRLQARLVDFGGWEMPLNYGSQIEEHHQVRRHAGMFDVSHMLAIDVEGPAARALLERLLANDVARLTETGAALYSCMLNENAGILDDLLVYFRGPHRYRLVVNASTAETDLAWIMKQAASFAQPPRVTAQKTTSIIAVQGPVARECVWSALPATREATAGLKPFHAIDVPGFYVARTGYTGEDGFEIMTDAGRAEGVWEALLKSGVAPAGLGARDTLRLEAGMNLNGQDMDTHTTPAECGLTWTVQLGRPRDFIGRKVLESSVPRWHLHGLVLLDRGVLRAHQHVRSPVGDGETTSGSFSPTLDRSIALARLPVGQGAGDEVEVEIRDRWLKARVVKYPFVRHGRSLLAGIPEKVQ
jgi:aminomethyltransferase